MARERKRRGRGEGSIEQLPSGKYRVVLSAGVDAAGKRIKVTETFATKKEAIDWRDEKRAEMRSGVNPDLGKTPLVEWVRGWLARKKGKVEPGTWAYYESQVRRNLEPAIPPTLTLARTTALSVEEIIVHMREKCGRSQSEQAKAMGVLYSVLKDAVDQKAIPDNPARKVQRPKSSPKPIQFLDTRQTRQFLAVSSLHKMAAVWELAVDSGARQGELLALHWPEVDLKAGTMRVTQSLEEISYVFRLKPPKSKKSRRTIILAPHTVAALRAHRDRMREDGRDVDRGPVFVGKTGELIGKASIHRQLKKLLAVAGLPPMKFHALRHTNATMLLRAGINIKLLSERLGHEDIAMTLRIYAHILDSDQGQAAAAVQTMLWGDCPTVVPQPANVDGCSENENSRKC